MKQFSLSVLTPKSSYHREDLVSFRGRDHSGSYGILANRAAFVSVLSSGLTELQYGNSHSQYLAFPGGLLRFSKNQLTIIADFYLVSDQAEGLTQNLQQMMQNEESRQHQMLNFIQNLDKELLRKLRQHPGERP